MKKAVAAIFIVLGLLFAASLAQADATRYEEPQDRPQNSSDRNISQLMELDQKLAQLARQLFKGLKPMEVKRIAVLDFAGPGGRLNRLSRHCADTLRGHLLPERGKLFKKILTRNKLYDLLLQEKIETNPVFETRTIAPIFGSKLKVDGLVLGSINPAGESFIITAELYLVSTGEELAAGKVYVPGTAALAHLDRSLLATSLTLLVEPDHVAGFATLAGVKAQLKPGGITMNGINQGVHTLLVSAPGYHTAAVTVQLFKHRTITVPLKRKGAMAQPPIARPQKPAPAKPAPAQASRPPRYEGPRVSFWAQRYQNKKAVRLEEGQSMRKGDLYRLKFTVSEPCYVYIYQEDPSGLVQRLFPYHRSGANPVRPGHTYTWPSTDPRKWVRLDGNTPGVEKIYLLASRQRPLDLEKINQELVRSSGLASRQRASRALRRDLRTRSAGKIVTVPEPAGAGGKQSRMKEVIQLSGPEALKVVSFHHRRQ